MLLYSFIQLGFVWYMVTIVGHQERIEFTKQAKVFNSKLISCHGRYSWFFPKYFLNQSKLNSLREIILKNSFFKEKQKRKVIGGDMTISWRQCDDDKVRRDAIEDRVTMKWLKCQMIRADLIGAI